LQKKNQKNWLFSCCCCNFTIGYLGYQRFVAAPQQEEAAKNVVAQQNFQKQLME
jgi:hypothetical protein